MRAFLLMLLFTLLQLPAAAALTCGEPVATLPGAHVQHHQNGHAVAAADAVADTVAPGDGASNLDCSTCHAHGAAAVLASAVPVLACGDAVRMEQTTPPNMPTWHARPDRPQWAIPMASGRRTCA